MSKTKRTGLISFLVVVFMIAGFGIAGAEVVTLKANVPAGKMLKAYGFTITYDASVAVKAKDVAGFTSTVNDEAAGTIVINGFNVDGVEGKGKNVPLVELTVDGSAKDANISVTVDSFGSGADKFADKAAPVIE
jgi:hypothetical protein